MYVIVKDFLFTNQDNKHISIVPHSAEYLETTGQQLF